jgi:L-ascorbate metabolism protein UlaG (beta-lactamase superfamily)
MRLRNFLLLSVTCMVTLFATGMNGCNNGSDQDLLDLSISRSTLFWWGHSTFTVTSADGHVVLIDPYDPELTGYPRYQVAPDLVLFSDNDSDHNDTSWWINSPTVVHGLNASGEVAAIDQDYGPFHVTTVPARHWSEPADQARGNTAMFVIEVDGVRIVHMGDLGQTMLDDDQMAGIGTASLDARPDFLMIPVGGGTTIDGAAACDLVDLIRPGYVLPMHFRTDATAAPLSSQLDTVDPFVDCFQYNPVTWDGNGITLDYASEAGASATLLLLDYLPR